MTGVLTEATGRQDILLRRGVTTQWGVRWERSTDGGASFEYVDLRDWEGMLELRSHVTSELWLSLPLTGDASGLMIATVSPDDLDAPAWAARSQGTWLINATAPDGHVERLGDGYFHLEA